MEMSGSRINVCWVPHVFLFLIIVLCLSPGIQRVDGAAVPMVTEVIYGRLSNLTTIFSKDIKEKFGFCIKDVNLDWNGAFDFSGNLDFLTNCNKKTKGDLTQRLCTAAEIKFYFSSIFGRQSADANYLKPNRNCNLTSWVSGCEPGWGCSVGQDQKIDLKNSKRMPHRNHDCQPCCEGFFCPQGITCMIPCPLGSYCPRAKLNKTTGICNPHYCTMGSTSEKPCFKFTTCNPKTENQNIHAYGIVLIAALSTLLLIIYNCSDQVLTTRERRQAKSREAAIIHARETAQARKRWVSAKNVAKKRTGGLQEQLSRTFSRKKSARQSEQLKVLGHAKPGTVDAMLPPLPPGSSSGSKQSAAASKGKKKEPSNLTKMLHSLEENPDSHDGFNLEIGDKNIKKNMPKGKQMHTHSQIFKYAYGQLEKEKAMQQQNKDLTFSGVISMATGGEIRTRPVIEVAFKDLTLTLKGKNKHLLRCVSGKFMPGRVSAVMGPSGAGKTTFLSALAGKVTGCTMTGLILINGKFEAMDSYKKIIGFVPQDDIVHGNLTVEENLQFSARCRLSADMPKPDRVLVVERVIECLGLQAVRDSMVGTVEKRGISGGQRKRVNVGLEMVMEPSLLILDEPTTGLDSSSSQLLLRALRREALEGVNICMVVHQPSYALFKMFDDLILLAKGGLTAYHGSAKKVEEYFAGLGISVPERVNPPDHIIDILEGIVKPSSSVTREQLPVRWMLHNGYAVPPDMLQYVEGIAASSTGSNPSDGAIEQSFAGDLWQDVMSTVELKRDHIQHNFLKSKDLSNRRTPGVARQYRYFLGRVGKQRLREGRLQAADYLILLLAGASMGTLAKVGDETFGSLGYTYTVIAVSLLCKISALRTFSMDKLHYWRESASGISSLAHFLSKDAVDLSNIVIKPLVYLSMFYFFGNPRSSFADNYIVLLCLVYCVTGIAYVFAIYLDPSPAQLLSVLLPVVLTLIAYQDKESILAKYLGNLCYTKWALEAFIIANAERYSGVWLITRCNALMESGYNLHDWALCLCLLILTGVVSRVLAFFCMVTFQNK
ncbi:putative white-brown complex homolog protein 30 isoform X2 [Corylus avellana]|uniref:putative white-brown complex homolog protein 30 isoform X2 n=1 Tax=Corylus avellana TaxID=13451 RepID=UPI00286AD818|nr:putative white-brown complex homolog protein 30 isoform X2 [Corylus avellana]